MIATLGRQRTMLLGSLAGLLGLFAFLAYGGLVTAATAEWIADLTWAAFALAAAVVSFLAGRRQRYRHRRRAWTFFALGALSWFGGMVYLIAMRLTNQAFSPFPTPANWLFAGLAPLFLVGCIEFGSERTARHPTVKQLADLGVIASGVMLICVVALLEPVLQSNESLDFRFFSLFDPSVFAVALLFALWYLWTHDFGRLRRVFLLLVASLAIHAGSDLAYFASVLGQILPLGESLEIFWLLAFSFQIWAAYEQLQLADAPLPATASAPRLRVMEALLPTSLALALLVVGYLLRDNLTDRTIEVAAPVFLVFTAAMAARELLSERQERRLVGALRSSKEALEISYETLEQKLGELDEELGERRRVETALKASERRIRDFAETAADWFWETGPDQRFTFLSERYETISGVAPERHLGKRFAELTSAADPDETVPSADGPPRPFQATLTLARPDGGSREVAVSGKPVFDVDGELLGYRGSGRDVTPARRLSEELSYQASHDSLTGLYNRREFKRRLRRLVERAQGADEQHVLCYADLDQFKVINDTCGHAAGDEMLRQIAGLLRAPVRRHDTLARLGGDEFGILLESCSPEGSVRVVGNLIDNLDRFRFAWGNQTFSVGMSVGLVPIRRDGGSPESLLAAADRACYVAKERGGRRFHLFRDDDVDLAQREVEMRWVGRIQSALEENRFCLYRQAIVPLATNRRERRCELLLRMIDEHGEHVPASDFLPAAERFGLASALDRWVLRAALDWLAAESDGPERLALCSINLSGHSLGDESFAEFARETLAGSKVEPARICFEITETAAIANLSGATELVETLREMGCRFALDDFGSGLSSFAYLKTLPVDLLKIDGLFVRGVTTDPLDLALVRSIQQIGRVLGQETIAEFVEDDKTLRRLRELEVDWVQGYRVERPRPAEVVAPPETARRGPESG